MESFTKSIYDLPSAPTETLAYMQSLTTYIDMTAAPAVGGAVEATFKIAGAYKRTDTRVYLETVNGYTIDVDTSKRKATIAMGGATYSLSDDPPANGRRLETAGAEKPMLETITTKQLVRHTETRRRKLNVFGGALLTSGSFTMMATSSF